MGEEILEVGSIDQFILLGGVEDKVGVSCCGRVRGDVD